MTKSDFSRRDFIKISSLSGASLLVGFNLSAAEVGKDAAYYGSGDSFVPNAWVQIDRDNQITILVNHSEMGQGVLTSLPMILADELEADWSLVRSVHAPVADVYKNPYMRSQATGGSTSVSTTWDTLREAGAVTRQLFISAAAKDWGVNDSDCYAENSHVYHRPSKRSITYGELVDTAAEMPIPEEVILKDPGDFKIIGTDTLRIDTAVKTDGSAIFGTDVDLPGMLNATVIHSPVFGATVLSVDDSEAIKMKGVQAVIRLESGVAVVTDTFWQAKTAADRLKIEWSDSEVSLVNSEDLSQKWREAIKEEGKTIYEAGDVDEWLESGNRVIEAVYECPYQAHATQEPMSCVADVRSDRCDIYAPTQGQGVTQGIGMEITGLSADEVNVYTTFLGGGFGRKMGTDYVRETIELSKAMKRPVKLIWTREEDMTNDFYRPACVNAMTAVVDDNNELLAWRHRMIGPDHFITVILPMIATTLPGWMPGFLKSGVSSLMETIAPRFIAGKTMAEGAGPLPYDIANQRFEYTLDDPGIPVGIWRSVTNSTHGFVVDSFLDEIALATGTDPYQIRLKLLRNNPRLKDLLVKVVNQSGWGKPLPGGHYHGLATHKFHDTFVAMVVEISLNEYSEIKTHKVVVAVDCGTVINPKTVVEQMESCVAFGLSATLKGSITVRDGEVEQTNFDTFPIIRMDEMPEVEVIIAKNNEKPTGIGEAAVPLVAPAVANALFAATGKRIRKIPILPEDIEMVS